ncbi:hypothetical protein [Streptomyces halobius]|nr:hypothetical protein [Streptomyces halobius]
MGLGPTGDMAARLALHQRASKAIGVEFVLDALYVHVTGVCAPLT